MSFGDLILAVGLLDVAFHISRRSRPRRAIDLTQTLDLTRLADDDLIASGGRRREVADDTAERVEHL